MGGYGSGRRGPRPDARPVVEHALRLDVDAFRRAGLPLAAQPEDAERRAALTFAATLGGRDIGRWIAAPLWPSDLDDADDDGANLDAPDGAAHAVDLAALDADGMPVAPLYRVGLEWRRVGYGWRPFFACPWCDAPARFLYSAGPDGPPLWTCRACAGLAYRSTRQADFERHEGAMRRAAAALGAADAWTCDRGALYGAPDVLRRPLGMRLATYRRRLERYQDARLTFRAALALELSRGWARRALGPLRSPGSEAARRRALADWQASGGRRLARLYGQRRTAAA